MQVPVTELSTLLVNARKTNDILRGVSPDGSREERSPRPTASGLAGGEGCAERPREGQPQNTRSGELTAKPSTTLPRAI